MNFLKYIFSLILLFWKIKTFLWDYLAVHVPPQQVLIAYINLYETWYVYDAEPNSTTYFINTFHQ
jgi:hypothetical protein